MMKDKLSLQDIVDALAKKTKLSKKEADAFFREFLAVITDNVFNNEPVKIKDFGTFKLTLINSRESVDVNTGDKIEIPAHYKLSFLPDKALKNLVNKPFEQFETVLLEENVSFDSIEVSEEPADLLEDEDTSIDEIEIDVIPQTVVESKPAADSKPTENKAATRITTEVVKQADVVKTEITTPSYVYTYTSSSKKDTDEDAVTLIISSKKIVFDIDIEREIPLNINRVHEKINQLKEAIDALTKMPSHIEADKAALPTDADTYEDITEEIAQGKPERDLLQNLVGVDDNAITLHAEETDTETPATNNLEPEKSDCEDFNKESGWNKFYKRLPIILFVLAVMAVGAYYLLKLLEQKDTVRQKNEQSLAQNDSIRGGQSLPSLYVHNEAVADSLADASDSLRVIYGAKISDNLDIEVVNKAAYLQSKGQTASEGLLQTQQPQQQVQTPQVQQYPQTEIVRTGSTLRSISRRHYGTSLFWVYIYEENKSKIANADNLIIGQEIVVPSLSKYNAIVKDSGSIERARKLEQQIMSQMQASE